MIYIQLVAGGRRREDRHDGFERLEAVVLVLDEERDQDTDTGTCTSPLLRISRDSNADDEIG